MSLFGEGFIFFYGVTPLIHPTGQVSATMTASRPSSGSYVMSSTTEKYGISTSLDESDDTKPDADDLAAARAQLKARAGAKGRRNSRPGRGGHGLVRADRNNVPTKASHHRSWFIFGCTRLCGNWEAGIVLFFCSAFPM